MYTIAGTRPSVKPITALKFGHTSSNVEDYLQTLRQNGQKITNWSLLYVQVPQAGRITQGYDPVLGRFRLFGSTTGPERYSLEITENGKPTTLELSEDQYDAIRTDYLRDIADEKIGAIYGLTELFGLTKLLDAVRAEVRQGHAKLHSIPAASVNIEGITPDMTSAKKVMRRDGTTVTLMVRSKGASDTEYFVGLEKQGFPGQIIAASGDDEKTAFYELISANNVSLNLPLKWETFP